MQGTDRQRGQITRISAERDRLRDTLDSIAEDVPWDTPEEMWRHCVRVAQDALASTEGDK
jgi:hypothetical protein